MLLLLEAARLDRRSRQRRRRLDGPPLVGGGSGASRLFRLRAESRLGLDGASWFALATDRIGGSEPARRSRDCCASRGDARLRLLLAGIWREQKHGAVDGGSVILVSVKRTEVPAKHRSG